MSEREATKDEQSEARERVEEELLRGTLDLNREAERLSTMGEPTRFILLYLLTEEGRIQSGELADQLNRKQNDLYHHLNTLEEEGLVGKFREGNDRIYELTPLAEAFVPRVFDTIKSRSEAA